MTVRVARGITQLMITIRVTYITVVGGIQAIHGVTKKVHLGIYKPTVPDVVMCYYPSYRTQRATPITWGPFHGRKRRDIAQEDCGSSPRSSDSR